MERAAHFVGGPFSRMRYTLAMNLYYTPLGHAPSTVPHFSVRGNKIYANPSLHSGANIAQPWFQIKGDKVYQTVYHPEGRKILPQFEIKNNKVFTTTHHPNGRSFTPIYKLH